GQPVRWPHTEVRGGPLNTQTVDGAGRVLYRVDSGPLGTLTNAQATALVDRIFNLYTDIPTADIQFVNAGPILDPATGNPIDITATNAGKVLSSRHPAFQNPIIFDSDGSITGVGGVLGFFGFLQIDDATNSLQEGFVVLNGAVLEASQALSVTSFLGVFTHEFGHFAGPLDHSQINGNIALNDPSSIVPPGFNSAQAFDLYAPFTETLFPFLFSAPRQSQLHSQFPDSGFFVATLDMDTQNALSNLYPTPDYLASRGSIEGRVLLKFGDSEIPISGINVVARRIDQGVYPPPLGTVAFLTPPAIDGDGIPESPPAQASTDSLATVSSAVTGLDFGQGAYRIQGLPPGQYLAEIQQINPDAVGGSGIGPLASQFLLPVKEEFFNGPDNSSNSASVFVPVTVSPGQLTSGIDFVINGISTATPVLVSEIEPNEKDAQALTTPVEVSGEASTTDAALLKMNLPGGLIDPIEDLYKITVDQSRIVFIILEPTSGSGDLDLYLFNSAVTKKEKSSLNDPNLLSFSAGATASETIAFPLNHPGTYIIGVSAFSGSLNYRLRIFASQKKA
ncbi:MAG TPA: PPC domain-containing protein, partial [Blastocatellia bacterium]|nr:PPC domain-containing protein [Blastocatellia bacterium]